MICIRLHKLFNVVLPARNQLLVVNSNYRESLCIRVPPPWLLFCAAALAYGIGTLFAQYTEPISIAPLQFASILQAIIMESPWERHFV